MRLFVSLLTSVLVASAVPARAGEPVKITVPAASVAFASLYHAKSAGYFAEEGLDIDIITVAGPGSIQAVLARDAQFAMAPGTYHLIAHDKGQRLLALMSILTRNSINVVVHKDIARERGITEKNPLVEKIKALKGLKLSGAAVGSFSYQVLTYYLLRAGFDPQKDVQLIGIGAGPPMLLALEQRKVDAFSTGTPIPDAAVARGFGLMVVDNAAGEDPDFAEFMMNAVITHPDYLKEKPDVVRKVLKALVKANGWLLDHPIEEAVGAMKPFLGRLDDKILLEGLRKTKLGIPRDPRITEKAVQVTEDFMIKIGALKNRIPYDKLVTNEYLPR